MTTLPEPLQVRRATVADAALLAALGASTFAETWAEHNTPEDMAAYLAEAFGEEKQREELADEGTVYLIAEAGGEALGYARLHWHEAPGCVSGPAPVELVRLYVRRAWHDRKAGAALMVEAMEEARRRGAGTMWLGVWPQNFRALRFYRAWGFGEVGRKPFRIGDDVSEDLILARLIFRAVLKSVYMVAAVVEPILRVGFTDPRQGMGQRVVQGLPGAGGGGAQPRFEFAERQFDGVEIRRIRRQE